MRLAMLGAGNVGATLGRRFAALGHEVCFGVRQPTSAKNKALAAECGPRARAATLAVAASSAEVVFLATPWAATHEAIGAAGGLAGQVVLDCTNPLNSELTGLTHAGVTSGAEQVAMWAPQAKIAKAFHQVGSGVMANPRLAGLRAALFLCGDDDAAKKIGLQLASEIGFEAIDAGPLKIARLLEPYALLWIHLATRQGLGRDFAFALARRGVEDE